MDPEPIDPADRFYQQLDSENALKQHSPALLADAREILATHPNARVAGLITLPDSSDGESVRKMLMATTGQDVPARTLIVGVIPRHAVEALLGSQCGDNPWREESWQHQQVLPVVVSTRDGFQFGFFELGSTANDAGDAGSQRE